MLRTQGSCISNALAPKWHRYNSVKRTVDGSDRQGGTMASNAAALERERISARIPKSVRKRLEEAADRSGATLNQFLVQAAIEKADLKCQHCDRPLPRGTETRFEVLGKASAHTNPTLDPSDT